MTTDQRKVPIKKEPITKITKEELKKSTADFVKIRTGETRQGRFKPMWMRHIPQTIEDFEEKEKKWLGFHYALENIGLDYKEVKRRLKDKLPPWKDEEAQI